MRFLKIFLLGIIVSVAACGDKDFSQKNGGAASKSLDIQKGSLPFKIISLNQSSQMYCSVFFETTNNSQNTLSMTLNGIFKTPQNQVIESTLRVIKVRGGQTVTDNILVEEQCGVIGSFTLTNTTTCEVDGQFVNDDICWNQFNPQPGLIPVYK